MGPGNRHDDEPLGEHHEGGDDPAEDLDDERSAPPGPLPDPLDRVWLHPSELAALGAAFAPPNARACSTTRHRSPAWLTPLLAGAAGALLTVGVLAVTGTFDRSARTPGSTPAAGDGPTRAATVADTLARLSPSVVAVVARDDKGTRRGSGVCVRHGAQVLTSTRVVGSATTVQVLTSDGHDHTARVAGRDQVTNLVLLDLQDDADVPAAQLSDDKPTTGSSVWILGAQAAGAKTPWMSGGMTSSNDAIVESDIGPTADGLLETDAKSNTTVVGGALVDGGGTVAGIVVGHVNGSSTTYAVPISVAVGIARQLDASGVATHGTLGMSGVDTPLGPMISKMAPDAPAARAGLHVRDLVESVNGRAVESMSEVTAIVQSLDPGRTVVVDLRRGSQTLEVQGRLGSMTG